MDENTTRAATTTELLNFGDVQEAVAEALGNRQGRVYLYLLDSHGRAAAVSNVTVDVREPEHAIGDDPVASVFLDVAELDHGPMVCLPSGLDLEAEVDRLAGIVDQVSTTYAEHVTLCDCHPHPSQWPDGNPAPLMAVNVDGYLFPLEPAPTGTPGDGYVVADERADGLVLTCVPSGMVKMVEALVDILKMVEALVDNRHR